LVCVQIARLSLTPWRKLNTVIQIDLNPKCVRSKKLTNRSLPDGMTPLHPIALITTWFGAGLLPKAPGTWGSLAALPFAWMIVQTFGMLGLALATLLVFGLGVWASDIFVKRFGGEDPQAIVIDEVAGQWLVLVLVPADLTYYAAGFVLFRVVDIFKPWPANWADREVKGGLGVMLDDVLAAPYAMAVLYGITLMIAEV
jgi:phosphatidylglycerophosphatase A